MLIMSARDATFTLKAKVTPRRQLQEAPTKLNLDLTRVISDNLICILPLFGILDHALQVISNKHNIHCGMSNRCFLLMPTNVGIDF